jgi:chemotaxis methyl-accepting protein methylase
MIFSIQRDLEDYFNRCGFTDPDQYAVAVAKLYDRERQGKTPNAFLSSMTKIRTAFFRANDRVQRAAFERKVLTRLDGKFKKKVSFSSHKPSPKELRHQAIAS